MSKITAKPRDALMQPMMADELRSHLLAAKEARRGQMAALPILEKFRAMERMKEAADPIRAFRRRRPNAA